MRRAFLGLREGERDGAQRGRPLFVRKAGHDQLAINEGHLGDGLAARRTAEVIRGRLSIGRIAEAHRGVLHVVKAELGHVARCIDAQNHRGGVGARPREIER